MRDRRQECFAPAGIAVTAVIGFSGWRVMFTAIGGALTRLARP